MNVHVVAKVSQGLANYLTEQSEAPSVVIGFDSRLKSDVFARVYSSVFAANGNNVFLWRELKTVPTVSCFKGYLYVSY